MRDLPQSNGCNDEHLMPESTTRLRNRAKINADESYMGNYFQTDSQGYWGFGKSRCHPGCNPDGKVRTAKLGFCLAIPPGPCRAGSSAGNNTPPADPSLTTTRKGSAGGDGKKQLKSGRGGAPSRSRIPVTG